MNKQTTAVWKAARKFEALNVLIVPPGLFRLSLAALVVVSHLSHIEVGRLAVALFFMLSGYWVSNLWSRVGGFYRTPNFLANRFFRIYPLYLIVVLICLLLFPVHITPSTFLLLGVASTEGPRAIGVEWSLDIEVEFYILFPIFYSIVSSTRRLWILIFAVLAVFGWYGEVTLGISNVFQYLPMFGAGIWLYRSQHSFSVRAALGSLAVFIFFALICVAIPMLRPQVLMNGQSSIVDADLFGMFWAALLIPYVGTSIEKRSNSFDRALGDSSFPLYLIHYPVFRLIERLPVPSLIMKGIAVLTAAIACWGFYFIVDRPIERIRRRVLD